ncbi:TPA: formate--phosphoribosylaminoimidazolecarboxamide ligase [Candidatus Micrarchaeota archaeon]|nr:formate--phosphoribosylaminoimidazolecarboxamide ligase [Candidatus Micrarchaeota archaeon]HIH30078.1 formate--phosphoribosylaminoimidazolecarboxamide ligase [Candidatus Micrarchaeota archaeon]
MNITREKIHEILKGYDKKKLKIATICSHTALQIFHGARQEGIKTIGITTEGRKKVYEAFPLGCPDEFIVVDDLRSIPDRELSDENAILVPHGSVVEYSGSKLSSLRVPMLGNRESLAWEKDREKMFKWMTSAGLQVPATIDPDKIDRPCVVKLPGAKGGRGYRVVSTPEEFYEQFEGMNVTVQEYLIGVRVYPHYFYSPLSKEGYRAAEGKLELMGIDRRFESNIDEAYRTDHAGLSFSPSFTVVGNELLVVRESLLEDIMLMGKSMVETADSLFGGIPGPFCLETVCDENLQFFAFEVSARIVAGTNIYPLGSPYTAYLYEEPMSMGRRIAREIKLALRANKLQKIIF